MKDWKKEAIRLANTGMSWRQIARELGVARSTVSDNLRKEFKGYVRPSELKASTEVYKPSHDMPKVLVMDIETSSMLLGGWGLYNQNYSLAQIEKDWDLLGYSAKWYGEDEVKYSDISDKTEEEILTEIWELLNSADIVIGHNCVEVSTPVLTQDLKWVPVGELKVGDKIVGFDEGKDPYNPCRDAEGNWIKEERFSGRHVKAATVIEHSIEEKDCVRVNLSNGDSIVTTRDHYWLGRAERDNNLRWYKSEDLRAGQRFYKYLQVWEEDKSYEAGWLSGFIAGEGTLRKSAHSCVSNIDFCQRPGETWDQALDFCDKLGIPLSADRKPRTGGLGKGDVLYTGTLGGKWKTLEYLGRLQIGRMINKIDWDSFGGLKGQNLEEVVVVSVEEVGIQKVAVMGTSSKTFIAGGYAMHNCRRFDVPKLRTRMIVNGFKPFSPVRFIDTLDIAKREFGFTSNKLEYLTNLLCKRYVKSGHESFSGYSLWSEFLKGNPEAIAEMREYCQLDTQSVEELYDILAPWSKNLPVFDVYDDDEVDMSVWEEDGYHYSNLGKYQRYRHKHTGQWRRGRVNLLSKEKRKQLLANII